ncbi:MAG: lytic transglycosylase domain-containing protein [Myxococcota bacterium]|nr:lytic transglycosylase domain-containing protein [Myxococcota bacterium]
MAAPTPAEVATAPPPIERHENISIEDRIFSQLEQHRKRMPHPELRFLAKTIVEEARTHAMDPGLILAVIQVESGCRHRAVSPVGARGLMQVMPSTGAAIAKKLSLEWKGEDSLFDPRFNIKLGVAYLAELEQRYGDIRKALVAYNWGPTRVDRMLRLGKTLPRTYVEIVLSTYESGRNPDVRRS